MCEVSETGEYLFVNPSKRLAIMSTCKDECHEPLTYKYYVQLADGTVIEDSLEYFPLGNFNSFAFNFKHLLLDEK